MRITVTQYAKSLYEITAGKTEQEIASLVKGFFDVLVKNRQLKLVNNIIERFSEISNKAQGIVEAEIVSVKILDSDTLKKIELFIINKYSAKKVIIKNTVNEKIKGGLIIKVGDELLDASVAGLLAGLKRELTK